MYSILCTCRWGPMKCGSGIRNSFRAAWRISRASARRKSGGYWRIITCIRLHRWRSSRSITSCSVTTAATAAASGRSSWPTCRPRPVVERSLRSAMEYALETDGIDGVVLDPWTSSATLDVSLLSGLLRSERGSDNPGAQELEAGHAAARAGDWPEAAARYTAAAEAGSAEALSALGDCLYYGRGTRKNKTQARRMWKKAAQAGEVQAMIALGDDCAASGGEMAETLQYYRRAQSAAREVPDIAYTPQVCLRLAQYETQYLSRKKALLQVAEAVQGFRILQAEGETDAADWLREAELLTDQLLADDKNA